MNDNYEYEYDLEEDYGQAGPTEEEWRAEIEKDLLLRTDRAINNYNKHYKHDKNEINTDIDITGFANDNQQDIDFVTPWQASPSEDMSLSQEAKRGNVSGEADATISYMKLDLFNNATNEEAEENVYHLHAKLSVKKHNDPNWLHASCSLNSEKRMAKRGLRMDNPKHKDHWIAVENTYIELREQYKDTRVSKFYLSGQQKGKSIKGLSLVLSHQAGVAVVIKGTKIHPIQISTNGLTQLQRRKHLIMSGTWTDDTVRPDNELDVDDWLGGL
jgi:hypothetical protein